jgi:hypothetical protein
MKQIQSKKQVTSRANKISPSFAFLGCQLIAGYLLDQFFEPEDGGIAFVEASVNVYRYTQRHFPEDGILHSHRCKNLKSCNWEQP